MYENGTGVDKDLKTAIGWYKKAAQHGSQEAATWFKQLGQS